MTRETFNQQLSVLFNAYSYAQERTTPESEEIYFHVFRNVGDQEFVNAVSKCLINCRFFPSIADIAETLFPPYQAAVEYNPWGGIGAKGRLVTPDQQLAELNRCAAVKQIKMNSTKEID